jgi:hypothetical protein
MMEDKIDRVPLPPRTVKYASDSSEMNEAAVNGMLSNPVYVGVPPYRRVVSDEAWIRAATQLIEQDGPEQFLVNMLYMLRASMVDAVPDEAIPDDYDGPWPDDDDDDMLTEEEIYEMLPSPWHHPVEGYIFCSHDDMPMIHIDGEFVCVAEYLYSHINNAPVTDLMTDPVLTLVFQNGHTLPLLCPDCGDSVHVNDHSQLLDTINGLTIIDVGWDDLAEELLVEFGRPGDEEEAMEGLVLHLDSVRGLTCPHKGLWHDAEEEENQLDSD